MAQNTVQDMISRLERGGYIPFRKFMDTALYGSDGYYNRFVKIGKDGADFYTAASSLLFALGITNAIVSAWKRFSCPNQFQVVELGAGQGELAKRIVERLNVLLPNVHVQYIIVEKSAMLASVQQSRILGGSSTSLELQVEDDFVWGIPNPDIDSVVIGNEVLDAFPVERIRNNHGIWERSYIFTEPGTNIYQEIWKQAPAWLGTIAKKYIPIPDGCVSELCLFYPSFVRQCANFGRSIEFIFIDYGIFLEELKTGIRPDGTMRGYRKHQLSDPLIDPGHMDITADVPWHIVEKVLVSKGFTDIRLQSQSEFLLANQLQSDFQEIRSKLFNKPLAEMKLVGEFKQLCMPGGFGDRFQVLTGRRI